MRCGGRDELAGRAIEGDAECGRPASLEELERRVCGDALPTLLVVAEDDTVIDKDLLAGLAADGHLGKAVTVHVVKGAGHIFAPSQIATLLELAGPDWQVVGGLSVCSSSIRCGERRGDEASERRSKREEMREMARVRVQGAIRQARV